MQSNASRHTRDSRKQLQKIGRQSHGVYSNMYKVYDPVETSKFYSHVLFVAWNVSVRTRVFVTFFDNHFFF